MHGLGGAKVKMLKNRWFKGIFEGVKGARAFQECEQLVEKGGFGRKSDLKTIKKKKKEPLDMRWQA